MEKKFRVLRIIGTLWKALAWATLIVGTLSSLAILLTGVLGSGGFILRLLHEQTGVVPGAMGVIGSVFGFSVALIATIIYFLILYAVGEMIYLLLAIEENTRQTKHVIQGRARTGTEDPASPPPSTA